MKTQIRMRMVMAVLTLALLAGGEARGQSRFNGSSDSTWTTAANWTPAAVPTASSNVVIGTTNAAVGAGGSPMTATIGDGDVCDANALTLGEHPSNVGTLTMTGGTLTNAGLVTVGSAINSIGTINLTNNASMRNGLNAHPNTIIGLTNGALGQLFMSGTSVLNVARTSDGGVRDLMIASGAGSTGIVDVTESAMITNVNVLTVGDYGIGTLNIRSNGVVSTGGNSPICNIGGTNNGGTVTISDNGTLYAPFTIGTRAGASGMLILTNNARQYNNRPVGSSLGNASGAVGRLYIHDTAVMNLFSGLNRNLTLGSANYGTGIVYMTGGMITNLEYLTIGNNLGYGDMTVAGGAVYATYLQLNPTGGVSSVLTVTNAGFVSGFYLIGGGADGIATVTMAGNSTNVGNTSTTLFIGSAARSTGRLYVRDNALLTWSSVRPLLLGNGVGSTGIIEVSNSGIITNFYGCTIGAAGAGYGSMTVRNSGKVYGSAAGGSISIGGTNNNSILTVVDDGYFRAAGLTRLGNAVGASGTLTVTNNGYYDCSSGAADMLEVGSGNSSIGWVNVNGGFLHLSPNGKAMRLGNGVGATGILTITSGVYSNVSTSVYLSSVGFGANSVGAINLQGGKLYDLSKMRVGAGVGSVGSVMVTGGEWEQRGILEIGGQVSSTGLVTVANCVSTNITGTITVGGGTTVGDRYGSVTISNATFGGATAMTILTNGFVELVGIGSVLRCSTLTVNGGTVTNHVRQFEGGVDVTSSAASALVITNGGAMHLVFDQNPSVSTNVWGLRWAGNTQSNDIQSLLNRGVLTWSTTVGATAQIYTNATQTWIGYVSPSVAGSIFGFK